MAVCCPSQGDIRRERASFCLRAARSLPAREAVARAAPLPFFALPQPPRSTWPMQPTPRRAIGARRGGAARGGVGHCTALYYTILFLCYATLWYSIIYYTILKVRCEENTARARRAFMWTLRGRNRGSGGIYSKKRLRGPCEVASYYA